MQIRENVGKNIICINACELFSHFYYLWYLVKLCHGKDRVNHHQDQEEWEYSFCEMKNGRESILGHEWDVLHGVYDLKRKIYEI